MVMNTTVGVVIFLFRSTHKEITTRIFPTHLEWNADAEYRLLQARWMPLQRPQKSQIMLHQTRETRFGKIAYGNGDRTALTTLCLSTCGGTCEHPLNRYSAVTTSMNINRAGQELARKRPNRHICVKVTSKSSAKNCLMLSVVICYIYCTFLVGRPTARDHRDPVRERKVHLFRVTIYSRLSANAATNLHTDAINHRALASRCLASAFEYTSSMRVFQRPNALN